MTNRKKKNQINERICVLDLMRYLVDAVQTSQRSFSHKIPIKSMEKWLLPTNWFEITWHQK